jgi:4-amino-4-deoxy-L-arabinose transferase-like glycosyltransferase
MQDRDSFVKLDLLVAGALTLVGALTRIPYLVLIPDFRDEVMQTVYALSIRPSHFMPLVGNDSYAGPLFSYILAICLRVFGASPAAPRIIALVMGALTVGLTYLLARAMGLRWPWATLAGLLMAANPHHILISSHLAGATYIVPLFSTAFLAALALAVQCKSGPWLVIAGVLLGLAAQATMASILMVPGVVVWFLAQRQSGIGLRTRWPYLAAAALVLSYAPVIVYNIQNEWVGILVAGNRSYAWQPNLSPPAYVQNLWRLLLELCRQVSGVLTNDESIQSLLGIPLVLSAWAIVGIVYAARRGISLPLLAVGSQVLIMPWLSNYYWDLSATRFTNHLTPLIVVAMGALAASLWNWIQVRPFASLRASSWSSTAVLRPAVYAVLVALSLWPLVPLFRYYEHTAAKGETSAPFLAFGDELVKQSRGTTVLVSDSVGAFNLPEYFLAVSNIPYKLMPIGRILERLATGQETGRVLLAMTKEDLSLVQAQTEVMAWDAPAVQSDNPTRWYGWYGVYAVVNAQQVHKPSFVLTDGTPLASTLTPLQVNLDDQISLIGYNSKSSRVAPGDRLIIQLYWKASGAASDDYMGFIHLLGPDGQLVTQDDHELGRGFYSAYLWQPDEIIREKYEMVLPQDAPRGDYTFRAGVYRFPSLERLVVRSSSVPTQDNTITFGTVHVGP